MKVGLFSESLGEKLMPGACYDVKTAEYPDFYRLKGNFSEPK